MYDFNEKEIEFAKELWKLIEKYEIKDPGTHGDYDETYFSNDIPIMLEYKCSLDYQ